MLEDAITFEVFVVVVFQCDNDTVFCRIYCYTCCWSSHRFDVLENSRAFKKVCFSIDLQESSLKWLVTGLNLVDHCIGFWRDMLDVSSWQLLGFGWLLVLQGIETTTLLVCS